MTEVDPQKFKEADEMIKIGHLNKADVLAALFNNARTQGMAAMHYKHGHIMDREEAQGLLDECTRPKDGIATFDYIEGRVMKIRLGRSGFDPFLYDRDNGAGAAQDVIIKLEERLTNPE